MTPHRNPDASPTGRLAPSPTGRLHIGNLSSALLAAIDVRQRGGRLLLRIEDLDPPRVLPGAEDAILRDLDTLGIPWDPSPDGATFWRQSERTEAYEAAFNTLLREDLVYPCFCSRRDVEEALSAPHAPQSPTLRYPGTCASRPPGPGPADISASWRFRSEGRFRAVDRFAGAIEADLALDPGDFVVRRRDGLFAYQLAVVVDDAASGVTDVLRGRDLLDSVARQLALWDHLAGRRPAFAHVPLLVDATGDRLSKRRADLSLDGLRKLGWTPALLRGALAVLWGWRDRLDQADLHALLREARWNSLGAAHIAVPDAFFDGPAPFDAWTRQRHTDTAPPARPPPTSGAQSP